MEALASGEQQKTTRRSANGYVPIEDYGLIGNLRVAIITLATTIRARLRCFRRARW
jgi:hypothetical protein